jgi:hypothetical protein
MRTITNPTTGMAATTRETPSGGRREAPVPPGGGRTTKPVRRPGPYVAPRSAGGDPADGRATRPAADSPGDSKPGTPPDSTVTVLRTRAEREKARRRAVAEASVEDPPLTHRTAAGDPGARDEADAPRGRAGGGAEPSPDTASGTDTDDTAPGPDTRTERDADKAPGGEADADAGAGSRARPAVVRGGRRAPGRGRTGRRGAARGGAGTPG